MHYKTFPKIGIALGSGGAKGLAHIGVLKVLEKHDIPIHYVAGSSIGALIGAYYAAFPQAEKLEELIRSFDNRKGFKLFDPAFRGGGLIKGNKVEKVITEMLEEATFDTLKIPYAAVTTDFNTAEEVIIREGDLVKAVRASISVPTVFQPILYSQKLLADGGLSSPVPVDVVKKMGSDIVIGVDLYGDYFPKTADKIPPLKETPWRSINILRHNLTLKSLQTADVIISVKAPSVGLIGWNYFFNNEKAQSLIKAGEDAALEALPHLLYLISKKRRDQKGVQKVFSFFRGLYK